MECHYSIDIYAPEGLRGIEPALAEAGLPLYAYRSGYNGKVILRSSRDDELEWEMDSSDTDLMRADGDVYGTEHDAETLLRSLSGCLAKSGFPHSILLDDPDGNLYARIEHMWPVV